MAATIEVKYFNTFLLKKTLDSNDVNVWDGSFGIPQALGGFPRGGVGSAYDWAIEESRITGGYNNTNVDYGVRAYLVEDDPDSSLRANSLIYSGIFNSRTGINNSNVFSVGEDITKSADPANGSIQKLYAEDSNLTILQELKVSRALIDKDAIYSAEGGGTVTSSQSVIGVIQPYAGNYGISKNPESFAVFGYRKYFSDLNNGLILRLSQDGLTPISDNGMKDFFRDELSGVNDTSHTGKVLGGWDIYNKQYTISIQQNPTLVPSSYNTLAFDESALGWNSFFTYRPDYMFSLLDKFYTLKDNGLWEHYSTDPLFSHRNRFYNQYTSSSITFVFNPQVSASKIFSTVNYEGSNGWEINSFVSDSTGEDKFDGSYISSYDMTNRVYSYNQGAYDNYGNSWPSTLVGSINRAGFDRKENKYSANLVNNSAANAGEVVYGDSMSGIKGYFTTVTISTDLVTNVEGKKELFAVSANYRESSY